MSYFDYYCKNTNKSAENKSLKNTQELNPAQNTKHKQKTKICNCEASTDEIIKGTCLTMCPEDEVLMREKAKMVHILEVIDGKRLLVKCYSRSAADSLVAVPRLLRPYRVLQETLHHLLFRILQSEDTSMSVMYDFVADRLRAIRQDMTVQRLSPTECVTLLEPMIRFHVYFGYKLCEYPIKTYDPVLNKKLLLECLKWFLSCCNFLDQSPEDLNTEMSHLNITSSDISMDQLDSSFKDGKLKCDRALMESLYILCNLDDVHPMYRYLNLPKNLKSHTTIKLAYEIAVSNLRGNFIQVCKQLDNLCPLTYCAVCLYLPTLQRQALQVLSAAYNSKHLSLPLGAVRRWLRFDSDAEAGRVSAYYGLPTREGAVRFSRGEFKADVATVVKCSIYNIQGTFPPCDIAVGRPVYSSFDSDAAAGRASAHYGLPAREGAVCFSRGEFKADVATHQPTRLLLQDQKMDLSIQHVFTYLSKDYSYAL